MPSKVTDHCPICQRLVPESCWEKHHLIPKSKKGKETVYLCNNCADIVHKLFSCKELETSYNTVELLLAHADVQKWIKWVNKKPDDFQICMKRKKRK